MFEHSVKVPRHYKAAANILKKVCSEGGSIKTLLYDSKLKHFNVSSLYALVTTAVRNARPLTRLFSEIQLLEKEPRLDPWLARILTIEILLGKKPLPGHSKPEQTLLLYKEQIEHFPIKHPELFDFKGPRRPRYVRVNTIKMSIEEFITWFEDEGYEFIPCTIGTYKDYLKQVRSLTEGQFLQDYHVKCIFVFHTSTKFHDHELYADGRLLLQDKASALAVELLAPERGASILDMCAAPGMKTTQAAAYVKNASMMYACERVYNRQRTLSNLIKLAGATRVNVLARDIFDVKKGMIDDVEYILLDPSCSGSGMDYSLYDYKQEGEEKLEKLTDLQEKLLRHATTSFPRAKRIVYSTCSLLPEENERVVTNVIQSSKGKWKVRPVKELLKGQWNNFGSGEPGSIASRCLYAKPESDLTKGFFLAVIDRNPNDLDKSVADLIRETERIETQKKNEIERQKKLERRREKKAAKLAAQGNNMQVEGKAKSDNQEDEEETESHNEDDKPILDSKNKSNKVHYEEKGHTGDDNASENFVNVVRDCKKKKRKSDGDIQSLNNITDNLNDLFMEEEIMPKKRRKIDKFKEIKECEPNASYGENISPKDTKHGKKVSKKRKRKNDVDINEVAEETQIGSELVSKKKKKYRKMDIDVSEDLLTIPKSNTRKLILSR